MKTIASSKQIRTWSYIVLSLIIVAMLVWKLDVIILAVKA